jgi:hypothetical protein
VVRDLIPAVAEPLRRLAGGGDAATAAAWQDGFDPPGPAVLAELAAPG